MKKLIVLAVLGLSVVAFAGRPGRPCRLCSFGDVNYDGSVDTADLEILIANFGTRVPRYRRGDLDGNRIVDSRDLRILTHWWGCKCQ